LSILEKIFDDIMSYNEIYKLDYEKIIIKLKPHLIKSRLELVDKLSDILIGKMKYWYIDSVILVLSELNDDIKIINNTGFAKN
jgi:hypothetical protein